MKENEFLKYSYCAFCIEKNSARLILVCLLCRLMFLKNLLFCRSPMDRCQLLWGNFACINAVEICRYCVAPWARSMCELNFNQYLYKQSRSVNSVLHMHTVISIYLNSLQTLTNTGCNMVFSNSLITWSSACSIIKSDSQNSFDFNPGRWFRPPDPAGFCRKDAGKSPDLAGNRWNMEAVFPPGIFLIFSDDYRTDPAGKHWNLPKSTENDPENSGPEYCFQLPSIFRCIPAVSRRTSFTWEDMLQYLSAYFSFDVDLFPDSCLHQSIVKIM